jgi:hypothetical protein
MSKKTKWIANLVEVCFIDRKKVYEMVVKRNLTKKDFKIISLFNRYE